ncbi:hypothetical protein [Ornithinimicrobium tianjinense]|uniref:DUF4878 domain-containing protein n=1 Tax=Ornithinimicrobium tianjinense TaxID=1195761 RepID=A0A917BGE4_9MICO|nr:hypothetical protein [Ornithinimicrobium tianjinense]GGF38078.1 hypothetical protein GCM10011366_02050 [Ornithinimicrobium tianjinense]
MRRAIATALTVPTLLLAACSDGDDGGTTPPPASSTSSTSDGTAVTVDPPSTDGATQTADDTAATGGPTGDATASTAAPSDGEGGEAEGGEEGQAAADVAQAFFVAYIQADPDACDLLLSFSDPSVPMADAEDDLEVCREVLPAAVSGEVDAQQVDAQEQAEILEATQIRGAAVDGDSAVVDRDNLSELLQDVLGDEVIALRKVDGTWYVDLDRSFQTTAP